MAKAFVSGIGWAEMQSKAVDITDNGSTDILPDGGNVLGKVTVNTNVPHYDDGYEDGKQAEWNAFWDSYQDNGNKAIYNYAFAHWNNEIFKPKYNMTPTRSENTFFGFVAKPNCCTDLVEILEHCNVILDLSKSTIMNYTFADSSFSRVGIVDMSSATSMVGLFYNSKVETIDEIILKADGSSVFTNWFLYAYNLVNVKFTGVIAQSGLNLQHSKKLSRASIESILSHLDDVYHGTARSITLSKAAVDKAFETSEGANDGSTSMDWLTWIIAVGDDYGKWTISLV